MHARQAIDALADETLVGKILNNLINNALNYSAAPPVIRLGLEGGAGEVRVTVADNGVGISPADQDRIFQRFVRGSDSTVRDRPGSGLGLYLSHGLAQRMDGSLELVSSQLGKGSSFLLRLPVATAEHSG